MKEVFTWKMLPFFPSSHSIRLNSYSIIFWFQYILQTYSTLLSVYFKIRDVKHLRINFLRKQHLTIIPLKTKRALYNISIYREWKQSVLILRKYKKPIVITYLFSLHFDSPWKCVYFIGASKYQNIVAVTRMGREN